MTKWILIIILTGHQGVSVNSVKFENLAACEFAEIRVRQIEKGSSYLSTTCVPASKTRN